MAKLFIVLAQKQKQVSHFRHLKKNLKNFRKKNLQKIFFQIHITKQVTRNSKMKKNKFLAILYQKLRPNYTTPLNYRPETKKKSRSS